MAVLEDRDRQETKTEKASVSFRLPQGSVCVYEHAADVAPEIWEAAYGDSHKDFEYYRLIEETMNRDFVYRYMVLLDNNQHPVALQPLILVWQDLAASANSFAARIVRGIRLLRPNFLRAWLLLAGCLVGEATIGLLDSADPLEVTGMLSLGLMVFARREKIPLVTIKDTPSKQRALLEPLLRDGFTRLAGFPPMDLPLDFATFEEYLTRRLGRITRKGLRRKLRKAERATPALTFEVLEDCSGVIDEIYPLYLNVTRRSPVDFEIFTREYFLEAGRRMPGRFRYFLWRRDGRIVAFSFCAVWGDTIYDNDIGLDYEFAHDLNLYYVTFRDVINWALSQGLKRYRSGPFNYDPKFQLRLKPEETDIYVRHVSPWLNKLISWIAPWFAPTKVEPSLRSYLERAKG